MKNTSEPLKKLVNEVRGVFGLKPDRSVEEASRLLFTIGHAARDKHPSFKMHIDFLQATPDTVSGQLKDERSQETFGSITIKSGNGKGRSGTFNTAVTDDGQKHDIRTDLDRDKFVAKALTTIDRHFAAPKHVKPAPAPAL